MSRIRPVSRSITWTKFEVKAMKIQAMYPDKFANNWQENYDALKIFKKIQLRGNRNTLFV